MNWVDQFMDYLHCVKSVRFRSFSGPYYPAFGLNSISPYSVRMRENTDQKTSEYEHFLRSVIHMDTELLSVNQKRPTMRDKIIDLVFTLYGGRGVYIIYHTLFRHTEG